MSFSISLRCACIASQVFAVLGRDLFTLFDNDFVRGLREIRFADFFAAIFELALHLTGSGAANGKAEVLAYGPVWGTGAAVVWWKG